MRKSFILLTFLCTVFSYGQKEINNQWKNQINPIFQGLDKSRVPHNILNDFAMEFTNVPAYNGILTDSTYIDTNVLGNIYKTLFMGKVTTATQHFPKMETVADNWVAHRRSYNATEQNTIVIAGLFYQYSRISGNALTANKITVTGNKYYDKFINGVWQNPYESLNTVAFTPAINHYDKKYFGVVLPQNLLLTNNNNLIQKIEVNFNDSSGYKLLTVNQKTYANYTQNGTFEWIFKTTLTNGTVLYSKTKVKINEPEKELENLVRTTNYENNVFIAHPNTALFSAKQGAILRIDYAPTHNGQIKKPFIIAEGFDAGTVLTPEVEGGDRTLFNFKKDIEFYSKAGNLNSVLYNDYSQEYDIIYIDWQNGTNDIKHNSEVLKNVLAWVNSKKQQASSTHKNVLLGQSMGGVIGRFTLAKMEQSNQTHDVRLFIAHDAPLQGSNVPISTQYLSRHAYDLYTTSPILYDIVEYVIPTILNFTELMSFGNLSVDFPSVDDVLTIQDTPAAMQMNYHYVDISSNPTMAIHQQWQQEFELAGYPQLCRNVAISNGNECAVNHGFNPRDKFISLHDTHNPDVFGDLLHLIITPVIGILTSDIELAILGLLSGSSKYFFDFDLHSNPNTNDSNRKVYYGKIRYEKKLLWLIPISHTITERSKNAPFGYLPFDTYSGGYYDIRTITDNIPVNLPSGIFVNPKYGFIPVVSALDIKRNNGNLTPNDYLLKYSGGTISYSGLSTSFNNFIVDFNKNNPINNSHISFQVRNGDWLANELNGIINNSESCANFCSNIQISGSNYLCSTGTYSVTSDATSVNWSITEGNSLVTYTTNGNLITLNQVSTNNSGYITISVVYGNYKCGSVSATKRIWVGRPNVQDQNIYGGSNNVYTNTSSTFYVNSVPGATQYYWSIYNSSTNCGCTTDSNGLIICPQGTVLPKFSNSNSPILTSTSTTETIDWGNCQGIYVVNCIAKNACGDDGIYYKTVNVIKYNGGGSVPCEESLTVYPNPVEGGEINLVLPPPGDPCDETPGYLGKINDDEKTESEIRIYDLFGTQVYFNKMIGKEAKMNVNLKRGHYVLNVFTSNGKVKREVIIVK